ncbi:membrane protein [Streptomyces sulfonofaciens]|uniref:Membrane protein n=1 Tax=Streptomyces sulfonofaciens TaxID=68272 RepID=A0A919G1Z4_9ACTN|nr:ATP-binding protein [Streptomyces sulfonofaciens]GHH76006.1 membrane protein [Streptomyces sulfonofaciens]
MARRPLPRVLGGRSTPLVPGRQRARAAAAGSGGLPRPLLTVTRGLRRLAAAGRRGWAATPAERRGPVLFLAGSALLIVLFLPFGPLLAVAAVTGAALWQGRGGARAAGGPGDDVRRQRLAALYEALVPHFSLPGDPDPLYAHGGTWKRAFTCHEFDADGRLSRLVVRYPAYFADGEAVARARVEHLVHAKSGRGREYRFEWDEEVNELTVTVPPPLPTGIAAQRFGTAPGETVLGFTDPTGVPWTLPVLDGGGRHERPPVVWRTGPHAAEPHLLAVGGPGSGTTTLLRSLALQALRHGDVLIVDGAGRGEYTCLRGRHGVLAVECGLSGALAGLEWAAHETRRRLITLNRARQAGHPPPEDARRPLWLLLDRPAPLGDLAAAHGRPDPQSLLQVPLRHGRTARVTVVVAERTDTLDALAPVVRQHARARVVLGPAPDGLIEDVLGAPPHTTPTPHVPPGRGYARLGTGPALRLQVPATPDPYDDAANAVQRQAVLDLLPDRAPRSGAPESTTPGAAPGRTARKRAPETASPRRPSSPAPAADPAAAAPVPAVPAPAPAGH